MGNTILRKSNLYLLSVLIAAMLVFFTQPNFAQGTAGKLTGKVIDAQTKEPLLGANIIVEGTTVGGVTNPNGEFIIINVPAGEYSVTASMIGYGKTRIEKVSIIVDRTTRLSFALNEASVEVQTVVVTAERPKIIRDQTSSSSTLDANQIKAAPVEGLRGVLDLSSSFQKDDRGSYSVRGSGAYEVSFQINGVEQTNSATTAPGSFGVDKANNSWKYDVNPLGVQQMKLITGGFSAEYGNAQAGVVQVVLKDGAPKFTGEFRMEYRPPGQYHYGPYLYDENSYEWKKWGSLDNWMAQKDNITRELQLDTRYSTLVNKIKLGQASADEIAAWDQIQNDEIRWAHSLWVANHRPSDDNPLGVYDYRDYSYSRYMFGFGGPLGADPNVLRFFFSGEYKRNPTRLPTSEKVQVAQNYILNVSYQPATSHKIKTMVSYQHYRGGIWSGSDDIRFSGLAFSPPGPSYKYYPLIDPVRTEATAAQSFNWVYTMDSRSFLDISVTNQNETYELPYEYLVDYTQRRDRLDSLMDNDGGKILRPGTWWETSFFRAPDASSTLYYQDMRTNSFNLKADYTNQLSDAHLTKFGVRFYYWDMFNNAVNYRYKSNALVATNGSAEYYEGYPINFAVYAQDKMEYEGMIANIGVRFEMYNFGARVPVDRFNFQYLGTEGPVGGSTTTVESETQYIVLPRLGLSFPIGEATAFRIQYGHFSSMPTFSQALSNRSWKGWQGMGNPNLKPRVTVQYEFGLQQVVNEDNRLDVALYYNDRVSQIGFQRVAAYTGSTLRSPVGYDAFNQPLYYYDSYANNIFGSTVGAEITFEKLTFDNWSYRFSYSLSQTMEGRFGSYTIYPGDDNRNNLRSTTNEVIASWDRTHNFRALIQYRFKEEEGFTLFGVNPLENAIISLTYSAQSGTPFTYVTDNDLTGISNNRRYPLESYFDLNANKTFAVGKLNFVFGVRIMNLFDNMFLTPISGGTTDLPQFAEYGVTMDNPGSDPTRLSYVASPYKTYRNTPRQIFFTFGVGF